MNTKIIGYDVSGNPVYAPEVSGTINSSAIAPQTPIPYVSTVELPVPDVSKLNTTTTKIESTPTERVADTLTSRLADLTKSLTGESAYRATQEAGQGVPNLIKTQNDLVAQLETLKNEATAIPLQLQNEATGRGITAGGLAPIQTGKLRENAIKSLTISSMLEATKGNIATARDFVDRAVAARFDPIKEEIKAAEANLNLILESPEYSREQKNRAQAQLDIQNKKKEETEKQAAEQKGIYDIALEAAKNGANSVTIQNILGSTSQSEALAIASDSGSLVRQKETSEKPLSILDVQRYQELYPEAGVVPGDSEAVANAKIAAINTPEAKTRSLIVAAKDAENDYETVVDEINNDASITDKETALRIAGEVFGIEPEKAEAPVYGSDNFSNIDINTRISQLNSSGKLNRGDIRSTLRKNGYPKEKIDSALNKAGIGGIGGYISSITNFLFGE